MVVTQANVLALIFCTVTTKPTSKVATITALTIRVFKKSLTILSKPREKECYYKLPIFFAHGKSGLVNEDARVRLVSLSKGGSQKFDEALENFNVLLDDLFSKMNEKEVEAFADLLVEIGGKLLMR